MGVFVGTDGATRVLYVQFEGILTDDVLVGRYQQVREWIDVHGRCAGIADFSAVTSFRVTTQGIRQLAALPPLDPDKFPRIIVASQDLIYGMARMFQILGSETRNRVEVVRTLAEAYQLIGVDVESLNLQAIVIE